MEVRLLDEEGLLAEGFFSVLVFFSDVLGFLPVFVFLSSNRFWRPCLARRMAKGTARFLTSSIRAPPFFLLEVEGFFLGAAVFLEVRFFPPTWGSEDTEGTGIIADVFVIVYINSILFLKLY
jgi:hypothetical protein